MDQPAQSVRASIVITTRNRADVLRRALLSCQAQRGVPVEVLVFDDASSDDTERLVTTEFPEVRYFRNAAPTGYIVLRNRGFREARGEFVFSIDDDAWFSDPLTVSQTVKAFEQHADAVAIALRFTEPQRRDSQGFMQPTDDGTELRTYVGCAHALRRDEVLQQGGYREYLIHQGEERDLCLRLMESGHTVRFLNSAPIVHEPSPQRDHTSLRYLGLRNTFLFDIVNVPLPDVLLRLPADVVLLAKHRLTFREAPLRAWNILRALAATARRAIDRRPVSRRTWKRYRSLRRHGAMHVSVLPSGQLDPEGRPVIMEESDG